MRSATFATLREANAKRAQVEVDLRRGAYVDPALARVTVGEWADRWLAAKAVSTKPATVKAYAATMRTWVLPTWGRVPLGMVTHAEVTSWVGRLSAQRGAVTVRRAHLVLSQVLESAVRDGRIARNPARGVDLPRRGRRTEHRYLTHGQVGALAAAAGVHGTLVTVLAYTGLRFGEAAALRVGDVDLMRRRVNVTRSVSEVGGSLIWGTPKTGQSRTVPLPRFLVDLLAVHMAGTRAEDLLFAAADGSVLRNRHFRRRGWDRAATAIGEPGLTPHALRHTAASLAVAAGADVKVVQRMLGHASAAMTLDVYADLFDTSLDAVADRLDLARSAADGGRDVA